MACYKPLVAFKPDDGGPIIFCERKGYREIKIPCGQCIGCRIRKREEWAVRCYCESKMHKHNHFLTLTYDDEHLPSDLSLNYRHWQLFAKKVRQKFGPFRFFVCGEYGDQLGRPHYHALLFGLDIPDLVKCNSVHAQSDVYTSEAIGKMWGKGFHSLGTVTYESARYCAVYTTKRITGALADEHYARVSPVTGELSFIRPEFGRMSLKPGIGMTWLEKYWRDCYVSGADSVIINGAKKPIPKFFDSKMDQIAADVMDDFSFKRYKEAMKFTDDNTRERLEVRERVATAKSNFYKERSNHAL